MGHVMPKCVYTVINQLYPRQAYASEQVQARPEQPLPHMEYDSVPQDMGLTNSKVTAGFICSTDIYK
ncbi:hypothetical protein DPMN_172709 [Dreissena polymorpha]|uniref:Uncharacterized protein n=1 Tax=Dreissena polymorpha TaxID=45954 RepID=A0A9D4IGV6_DREPO|nr:hypothetical protein DPMN_172709 [Dreissena polymorpha]